MLRGTFGEPLGRRLVLYTLLLSTGISTIASGLQLYVSYQQQSSAALDVITRVETSSLAPLENALWQFDFDQVETILKGIQADNSVAHVLLETSTGHEFEFGDVSYDSLPNTFDLVQSDSNGVAHLGTLTLFVTLEDVWSNIWTQFVTILATNVAKAWLVSLALLIIFHRLVTRHLHAIAQALDTSQTHANPFKVNLNRNLAQSGDALDKITRALTDLSQRSKAQVTTLENEVAYRTKAEQAALEAVQARKTFLANMSHEIRTPLNAMMGLFQLIEMSAQSPKHRKHAKTGLAAANSMLNQLNNVLEVSRLEANAIPLNNDTHQVLPLVGRWKEIAEGAVRRHTKDLKVDVDIAQNVPENVFVDEKRVTQIVLNLCDNAAKFTQVGALTIQISYQNGSISDGELIVSVLDTGPGIPSDKLAIVFERFAQVDTSLTRLHSGTGLGLSICRDIATLLGGQLSVESPVSCGMYSTCFELRVPDLTLTEFVDAEENTSS